MTSSSMLMSLWMSPSSQLELRPLELKLPEVWPGLWYSAEASAAVLRGWWRGVLKYFSIIKIFFIETIIVGSANNMSASLIT